MPTHIRSTPQRATDIGLDQPWIVILFNDDYHAFDDVVAQVQKATGCGHAEAFHITYAAHINGQAVAYIGAKRACERVASILCQIELRVEIEAA